jgi:hypothetical protein
MGNNGMETTPRKEWGSVMLHQWVQANEQAAWVPGVFEEVPGGGLRKVATGLGELHADAPARIHAMREARRAALFSSASQRVTPVCIG